MSFSPEILAKTLDQASLLPFFPSSALQSLSVYLNQFQEASKTLNLTKFTTEDEILPFHLLDSAHALPVLQKWASIPSRWMDLGTGGGFPGVVLAAALPQASWTLVDATDKKIKAVARCLDGTGLQVGTIHGRAEDMGQDSHYRESWDGLVSRAVADLPVLLEYGLPLLKSGGHLVNWMTEDQMGLVDNCANALKWLDGKIIEKVPYRLPDVEKSRWILVVEKLGKTPLRYPRPAGQPSKHPL